MRAENQVDADYTTEVISQNPGSGNPFRIEVNGNLLASIPASSDNTRLQLGIPWWMLLPGENILSLFGPNILAGSYTQFDYHRLELLPEPTTLGLLALARRRRTG
jgi:hypothetical protein